MNLSQLKIVPFLMLAILASNCTSTAARDWETPLSYFSGQYIADGSSEVAFMVQPKNGKLTLRSPSGRLIVLDRTNEFSFVDPETGRSVSFSDEGETMLMVENDYWPYFRRK